MLPHRFALPLALGCGIALLGSAVGYAESVPEKVDRLERAISNLESELRSLKGDLERSSGRAGPPGPAGPQGPAGPAGAGGGGGSGSFTNVSIGNGSATFKHLDGKTGVWIGSNNSEMGSGSFYNKSGTRVVWIGSGDEGGGLLRTFNKPGNETGYFGSTDDGQGIMRMFNRDGTQTIYVGTTSGGGGGIKVESEWVHDYAEVLELATREGVLPGSVVAMAADGSGIALASHASGGAVVGVVSGAGGLWPGMVLGRRADGSNDLPVAMAGIVYVRVSAEGGSLAVGDLLTTSSTPGVTTRSADPGEAVGRIVGKALEPYSEAGEGLVRMLVLNR